jgi:hypothetical protein
VSIFSTIVTFIKALPIIRDVVVAGSKWYKAVRKRDRDISFDEGVESGDPRKVSEELGRLT